MPPFSTIASLFGGRADDTAADSFYLSDVSSDEGNKNDGKSKKDSFKDLSLYEQIRRDRKRQAERQPDAFVCGGGTSKGGDRKGRCFSGHRAVPMAAPGLKKTKTGRSLEKCKRMDVKKSLSTEKKATLRLKKKNVGNDDEAFSFLLGTFKSVQDIASGSTEDFTPSRKDCFKEVTQVMRLPSNEDVSMMEAENKDGEDEKLWYPGLLGEYQMWPTPSTLMLSCNNEDPCSSAIDEEVREVQGYSVRGEEKIHGGLSSKHGPFLWYPAEESDEEEFRFWPTPSAILMRGETEVGERIGKRAEISKPTPDIALDAMEASETDDEGLLRKALVLKTPRDLLLKWGVKRLSGGLIK